MAEPKLPAFVKMRWPDAYARITEWRTGSADQFKEIWFKATKVRTVRDDAQYADGSVAAKETFCSTRLAELGVQSNS
jgi:hypothetical protein